MATPATPNTAYCVTCRDTRPIQNPQPVTMKNGAAAVQGVCPTCGTKLTRILARQTAR